MGPRPEDMTRHDLAVLTWQWIVEAYAELVTAESDEERQLLKGRCQGHSRALQFLLTISHEEVLERTKIAYERGLPPMDDEEL